VMHSDATLILVNRDLSGGTKLTETFARTTRKPLLVIGFAELSVDEGVRTLNDWLTAVKPRSFEYCRSKSLGSPGSL